MWVGILGPQFLMLATYLTLRLTKKYSFRTYLWLFGDSDGFSLG